MKRPTRLAEFLLIALIVVAPLTTAQSPSPNQIHPDWNVLYGHERFANAGSMVSSHIGELRKQADAERSRVIAGLQTPDELKLYQAETRAKLRSALGELPPRTPLNPRLAGTVERGDYAIENIIFESRPGYYVTANVYVPRTARPPYPAVLAPVGHWGLGKGFEEYQHLGAYLARRGYLVLVYDGPGQGERRQYFNPVLGRALIDPGGSHWFVTLEHGYAGGQAILTTGSYASHLIWDGIRALDYLTARPDVDPSRLACTGTSGGGLQTEVLSALDERIKVSIPVCYGGCNPDNPTRAGLSMTDIDALIVPRPLLMIEATGDPLAGVLRKQTSHQEIARLYDMLGKSAKTRFMIAEGPHGYIKSMYEAAYAFLEDAWPTPSGKRSIEEPIVPVEPVEKLFATSTGEVTTALGGESVFTLNRAKARELRSRTRLPHDASEAPRWRRQMRDKVSSRLAVTLDPGPLQQLSLLAVDQGPLRLEKVVYYSEPDIFIPGLLFLPKTEGPHPAVIFVNEGGKSAGNIVEDYLKPLAAAGNVVLSIDPRGMGETDPMAPRSSAPASFKDFVHDSEASFYYDSLRIGKTPLGARAADVIKAVDYLATRKEVDAARVSAIGHGLGGLIVLYAAALDDRIQSAAATRSLISYEAVTENELYTHRFTSFAPGAIGDFDLPEVAALVAPRPLLLVNSVDQVHRVAPADQVKAAYEATARIYGLAGAPGNFSQAHALTAKEIADAYVAHLKR